MDKHERAAAYCNVGTHLANLQEAVEQGDREMVRVIGEDLRFHMEIGLLKHELQELEDKGEEGGDTYRALASRLAVVKIQRDAHGLTEYAKLQFVPSLRTDSGSLESTARQIMAKYANETAYRKKFADDMKAVIEKEGPELRWIPFCTARNVKDKSDVHGYWLERSSRIRSSLSETFGVAPK